MTDTAVMPETQPGEKAATRLVPDTCQVVTLTHELCARWDRYVGDHPDSTLFHTVGWRDAVNDAFPHEPIYLTAVRGDQVAGVLPMFLVKSRLAGRMLVSVPYGVGGGIVADDQSVVAALFAAAKRVADRQACRVIDLRSERAVVEGIMPVDRYVGFRRELPREPKEVLPWLPRKPRAAARNARDKHGLTIHFGDEHLPEVWRLYSIAMRRLGSLTYPRAFFERLAVHTPDRHWVCLVKRGGRTVAGLFTFLFRDTVMPYFIGTTDEARDCSAANFIYLAVMERGVAAGYRVFDFGRSRRDNQGSYNFKRFHGFTARPLGYQIYSPPGCAAPNLSPDNPNFRLLRRLWKHLPLCVTRTVGARVARHIPG